MYKQVIVIRTDIKMSKGKVAAQASHAAVDAVQKSDKKIIDAWKKEGQKKIIVKAKSETELVELKEKCKKLGIKSSLIADAGKTELVPGTLTALGIGPDTEEKINKVTGSLKLLS
ncbi:MAG TPA: peptidyl-tRNA hydrolase Pth2 [archaeon]|nr:peptidyl-tRNA hydrolase Pth2 [archaeon]